MDWIDQVSSLIDSTELYLSNEMPSQWAENHRVMTTDVSPFPGKFKFDRTPYLREVLDTISPNHPAKKVAVMKGAQIGFALDEETLIPTPDGFVKMKHLHVGDLVFDENGELCEVTKTTSTMHDHECFDVHFSDGSVIKADAEHLWFVSYFCGEGVLNTLQLHIERTNQRQIYVDNCGQNHDKRFEIVDVVPCDSVPVRCISVSSKSKLFLAGTTMIPTHNSTGVIENGIGYIISQNPGNILFLTGHGDLTDEAMSGKIDQMIDSCGLRPMIRPNVLRKKNQRTGDTNKSKEFPGGSLVAGSAGNHKLLRQRSVRFGFVDDFDAARGSTKESGSTTEMIEQRFAAYGDKMKLYYISTPEVKQTSNIEPLFFRGDQRFFHVPCQCCGVFIPLKWKIDLDGDDVAGIHYKLDDKGQLVDGSVGYVCPECGGFFDDRNKYEFLNDGVWQPTAQPQESGFYSYHISSLYAPPGMYDWEHYVRQYLKANPIGEKTDERQMQTFVNLVLGETYEKKGEAPKANELQKNVRDYQPGTLPEQLSVKDGNGQIVLITLSADLNGKMDDARLDWECVAWTESGANYSIDHGSVGTFIPNQTRAQKDADDRAKFTYQHGLPNSVWTLFQEIIDRVYTTDTGRRMKAFITGIDVGNTFMGAPYHFIENNNSFVVGLKGKDAEKGRRFGVDTPTFRLSKERNDLYLVEVNQLKDELAEYMRLKWDGENDQPTEFMNYPYAVGKKYQYKTFFSHYEGEHRVIEKNRDGTGVSARWVKVNSAAQNHFWDCRIYNMVLRDIITDMACKEAGIKHGVWKDYVDMLFGRI